MKYRIYRVEDRHWVVERRQNWWPFWSTVLAGNAYSCDSSEPARFLSLSDAKLWIEQQSMNAINVPKYIYWPERKTK